MLNFNEIKSFYPEELHAHSALLMREYLQVRILDFISNHPLGGSLFFLGGTALRIVHGNRRFSEDLDFDNRGLDELQLRKIADDVQKMFQMEGYETELKHVTRGAWHAYIKFPGLLFKEGLSGYKEEKITIRLDAEHQPFKYSPERFILNRFEVFSTILTVPIRLLLAQKYAAILTRPRKMGRDFYDVVFLMGRGIQPDFNYLQKVFGISDETSLKTTILQECHALDMSKLAQDVEPFLFDSRDRQKVIQFVDYFQQSISD